MKDTSKLAVVQTGAIQPALLRIRDVEADLSLGKSKIYDMIGKGELKAVRIGRSVRVPRTEVERFLNELGVA